MRGAAALLPFIWMGIAAAAIFLAVQVREWIPVIAGGALLAGFFLWILGCALSPANPDRRCPRCREEGLVKLRRGEPLGVRCERCGYEDPKMHVAYLDEW